MAVINYLSNGIRVALEEIPYVRSISFGIWVGNGTRNETPETNGISHFIEHMMFKGTENRTAKEIAEEMDSVGGQINAYTTKEYTCYHTRVLDKHFDQALDVMSDMFLHSKFDEKDIKKECKVIIEEINMYDDAPEELVHDKLQEAIWRDCSLGMPILGTEKSISQFTRQTFLDYMEGNYQPQNTVVSVAGNFKEKEMMEKLEKTLGKWKIERKFEHRDTKTKYTPSIVTIEKDIEQVHLCAAFPSFERESKYKYPMTVFNTIFGGGMSSILFQKIREEQGLTYSIYSYTSAYTDGGLFAVYGAMSANQVEKVIALILQEIEILKKTSISEALLSKTKEQIISNFLISTESTANRMTSTGGSVLIRNKIQSVEEVIDAIERITIEDMNAIIHTIFDYSKISFSMAGNIRGIPLTEITEKIRQR